MKSSDPPLIAENTATPRFSIIIPTSNHHTILKDLVDSIKNTIPEDIPTEIIVVEDFSDIQKTNFMTGGSDNYFIAYQQQPKYEITGVDNLISTKLIQNSLGKGKMSSILHGIKSSSGENVIL